MKTYADRWEFLHSWFHHRGSHTSSKGILSPSQRNAVITSVKHLPMTARGSVMCNLDSLSPGKRVPFDARSARAVGRLVDATRRELVSKNVPVGIELDGSEGAMIQLAVSMSFSRLIALYNDIHDRFHLDEHQPICLGYQFKKNVRHMCLSTASMLINGARSVNSKGQIYLHKDGAYNWCKKDIGLLAFGLSSMGNHYNPLSISIVNSESIASITTSCRNTAKGLYSLFKEVQNCIVIAMMTSAASALCCESRLRGKKVALGCSISRVTKAWQENSRSINPLAIIRKHGLALLTIYLECIFQFNSVQTTLAVSVAYPFHFHSCTFIPGCELFDFPKKFRFPIFGFFVVRDITAFFRSYCLEEEKKIESTSKRWENIFGFTCVFRDCFQHRLLK